MHVPPSALFEESDATIATLVDVFRIQAEQAEEAERRG